MKKLIWVFIIGIIASNVSAQANEPGSGNALDFDGTSNYVGFGDVYNNLTLPFTLEGWVFVENLTSHLGIFASDQSQPGTPANYAGVWARVNSNGTFHVSYGDGTGAGAGSRRTWTSTTTVPVGAWVHFACVVESPTQAFIYFNGVSVTTNNSGSGGVMAHNANEMMVGLRTNHLGIPNYFDGQIDEVRLWDVARTQAQIRTSMCNKLTGIEPGLIGYWRMDEGGNGTCGGGTDVCDASGTGINGTLQ